jgi:hypothetical protein
VAHRTVQRCWPLISRWHHPIKQFIHKLAAAGQVFGKGRSHKKSAFKASKTQLVKLTSLRRQSSAQG